VGQAASRCRAGSERPELEYRRQGGSIASSVLTQADPHGTGRGRRSAPSRPSPFLTCSALSGTAITTSIGPIWGNAGYRARRAGNRRVPGPPPLHSGPVVPIGRLAEASPQLRSGAHLSGLPRSPSSEPCPSGQCPRHWTARVAPVRIAPDARAPRTGSPAPSHALPTTGAGRYPPWHAARSETSLGSNAWSVGLKPISGQTGTRTRWGLSSGPMSHS
jgi:hypothetical protein